MYYPSMGVGEIDRVNAFGQVVERDFVGGFPGTTVPGLPGTTVLPGAYPTMAAPRVVAPTTAYAAPTMLGGVGEIDRVNAFGQVVERDFVGGVPAMYGGLPATTAVAPTFAAPRVVGPTAAYPAPFGTFGEIDRVNAFGQVVERDFVGGVPSVYGGVPAVYGGLPATTAVAPTYAAPAFAPTVVGPTYAAPTMAYGGVGEIDRVNAFGQVVERDFVGGFPGVIGGFPTAVAAAPRVVAPTTALPYGAPTLAYGGVGEIDRVNAFGQVVERDFVGGIPSVGVAAPGMYPGTTVLSGSYAPPVVGAPTIAGPAYAPAYAPTLGYNSLVL